MEFCHFGSNINFHKQNSSVLQQYHFFQLGLADPNSAFKSLDVLLHIFKNQSFQTRYHSTLYLKELLNQKTKKHYICVKEITILQPFEQYLLI